MFQKFFEKRRISMGAEIEDSIMTVTQKEEAIIEKPFERFGLSFIWFAIILSLLFLAGRVFYLDYFQGEYYSQVSKGNRIRSLIIKAPRGIIADKYGKILAKNIPSIDAIVIPSDLPHDGEKRKEIAKKLSDILEMNQGNVEIILDIGDNKSLNPILLKENISQNQILIMAEKLSELPGIALEKTAIRSYEDGAIFSPIIGYDGKMTREELNNNPDYMMTDYIGKMGIEKNYEREIRGKYGATQVEIDSVGNIKRVIGIVEPQSGNDLLLNIDEGLQKKIYDSLSGILEKAGTKTAAAVAIDPRNGGVMAMVSMPSFDNNLFARGITNDEYRSLIGDKNLPFLNRTISGTYPPGSTIKPIIASAALSEGTIKPGTIINGLGGVLRIGNFSFGDWKVHSPSDVKMAIAESNDIFFYTVGGGYGEIEGLGMSRMKKYDNLFGLGNLTGIDLPGEVSGLIPDEQWKIDKIGDRWYVGDSYHAAIGQGFITATPIQLANFTAAIANGGTLYSPRIVNRIIKNDGTEKILSSNVINQNFISPEILNIVREGMRLVVTSGTARILNNSSVPVAGKTGTAQYGTEGKTHSWFISFAPYENPTIAMAVLVEGGGEGHSAALPVTEEVLKWYFDH